MAELRNVGWVGTGVMGISMGLRLIEAGFRLTVFTRTRERARPLVVRGAQWAESPRQLAEQCEAVVSMVGYPSDVESVYLGADGLLAAEGKARLLVDMTTSSPALARTIAERAANQGIGALDAPVSGGDVGAKNGKLSIMVGGTAEAFAAAQPLFAPLGEKVVLQGDAGSGQHTKMVNQILIATNMIGMCEGILYAQKAGLDPHTVLESVGGGAAGSWSVSNLAPRILDDNFEPGFYVEHFLKDMGIALAEAERMQLALPGLALAKQLYEALRAQGHGRKGTQALYLALRRLNGA
ncbi:MAG: NAD(P)-dependent oxidoreductase [Planctomycetota bacterium]